jgi:hypothetical protein
MFLLVGVGRDVKDPRPEETGIRSKYLLSLQRKIFPTGTEPVGRKSSTYHESR